MGGIQTGFTFGYMADLSGSCIHVRYAAGGINQSYHDP